MIKAGRTLIKFAFLPTKMSDGEWVWLTMFMKQQEWQQVWECISDLGWPDMGTWGWKDRWVTIRKTILTKENDVI